tara:strand:+ start:650 stop:1177 length:528 start_codon:yes stop_codon:yes gene_type:complete
MILWLISCWSTPQPTGVSADPFHSAPPRIVNLAAECSEDEGEWVFDVITEHWTGGGWVWMGTSTDNVEGHRLRSIGAAADGSTDALRVTLDIEPDWRDAARNKSTRFLCTERPQMSFLVTAYDPTGKAVADCRTWGADPTLWLTVEAAHDCETEWELPTDTGQIADTGESTDTAR